METFLNDYSANMLQRIEPRFNASIQIQSQWQNVNEKVNKKYLSYYLFASLSARFVCQMWLVS